ncbi:MAG: flavodoxin family protein [bacterium]|nr:flavodoxin family protein [bacterium]
MKVLLLNGSPDAKGCINEGLKVMAKIFESEKIDYEIIQIGKNPIAGCIGCASCRKTGECFRKDIANEVAAKLKEADGFVIGSPVYYSSPNGSLLALLDRVFYQASGLEFKVGASIVSCRRGGASSTFDMLNKYFLISNMPIAPSNYWNMIHGSKAEDIYKDEEGIQTLEVLARNMVFLMKSIKLGKDNNLNPAMVSKIKTNYIK